MGGVRCAMRVTQGGSEKPGVSDRYGGGIGCVIVIITIAFKRMGRPSTWFDVA